MTFATITILSIVTAVSDLPRPVSCWTCLVTEVYFKTHRPHNTCDRQVDRHAYRRNSRQRHIRKKNLGKTLRNAYVTANPASVLDVYYEIPKNAEGYDKFIVTGKFAQTFQPPTSAKIVYINPIGNPPPPPSNLTNAIIYLPRFDICNQNTKWINAPQKAKISAFQQNHPLLKFQTHYFNWYFSVTVEI